jgi:hypothetical protein
VVVLLFTVLVGASVLLVFDLVELELPWLLVGVTAFVVLLVDDFNPALFLVVFEALLVVVFLLVPEVFLMVLEVWFLV